MPPIDLRSDTVTRPTAALRAAMAEAEVGDDVYGEDPTVRGLEEYVAALLGKEAALFMPTGTMSNQVALLLHTRPGDEVIIGEGSHCAWNESGAGAAWAGVQFAVAGSGGFFTAEDLLSALKPPEYYYPQSALVVLENTHNRSGGRVLPQVLLHAIAEAATARGLALHLDGARLWNAQIATGIPFEELTGPFSTVSVCFSKGLGAPVGSALLGSRDLIVSARRFRKMLGGGMRQAGILAAGARYALEHHLERLTSDHENARRFAGIVAELSEIRVLPEPIETNMVILKLSRPVAAEAVRRAEAEGVLLAALGPYAIKAVTHLDVGQEAVESAAMQVAEILATLLRDGSV